MMPIQRACDAEMQARNKLSNGPLRARSNALLYSAEYSVTCGHTLVAGDMMVSCKGHPIAVISRDYWMNSRWHRG
ncbi:MAG: hypothetical protein IJB96_10050 [Lachnospira sp.]|nr:hypothetical protein [Lachnospira sp.]